MKVENLAKNVIDGLPRVEATVTWEESDRPQRNIYIETDTHFVDDISPNTNAFLLALIMPAMHHGEKRILLDGKLCPQLRNGLITAMQQLRLWYGKPDDPLVAIEASRGFEAPRPRPNRTASSFMSGGVDAMATLRCNRLDLPLDHPASIKDCFFVHGFDIGGYETMLDNRENSSFAIKSLTAFAKQTNVTLIPVFTNIRHLDESDDLFTFKSHGASLAAIAHFFSQRTSSALIASSDKVEDLVPWGSHPLLDPNYSSADVCIQHDGIRLSRPEKVGLIAEWDAALQSLRACYDIFRPANALNCGKCEKCLRTMTELLICDKLAQCPAYDQNDVSPELLRSLKVEMPAVPPTEPEQIMKLMCIRLRKGNDVHWRELLDPLTKIGRHDLVRVIEEKLAELEKLSVRTARKNAIREFDRQYLGGNLAKLNRLRKMVH